ncbi:GntR family transcriptional regulator [Nocardia brasiliensis]|uniref:GntR family transcriptional regulator n=1 Tax=Nocardia brasiliensis TaxID=37326 RepID=UPI002456A0EF|nr:GntR family transcriptional regulator [Nocardia brasiliensis]
MAERPLYQRIADAIRDAIQRGDYGPGDLLPPREELMQTHAASKETVSKAYRLLEAEGLLLAVRRGGTRVRQHPVRSQMIRSRKVFRDELGYYFDTAAQDWRALAPVQIGRVRAPWDIARLLNVDAGTEVVIRDRIIGDPVTRITHQLTASYIPLQLVEELPILEHVDTGSGGIYDRLEEAGHGPLTWHEYLSARAATAREAELLELAPGVPIQRIIRTSTDPAGLVCEVNAISLPADKVEIGYPLERHATV